MKKYTKREEYENKLIAEKGEQYLKENKELLDAQWDYIESLGDPDNSQSIEHDDLIISDGKNQ